MTIPVSVSQPLPAHERERRLRVELASVTAERDAARDMCCRLEHALHHLGAWDPTNKVGREMIREDLDRGGAASIERAR